MKSVILIVFSLLMTACVYVQNTHQDQTTHIDKQKMVHIEIGKTDKQWIIKNMGMPDKIQSTNDGLETYEYINESKIKTDRTFIFLFSIKSEKITTKRILNINFKNNIVESVNTRDDA